MITLLAIWHTHGLEQHIEMIIQGEECDERPDTLNSGSPIL